MSKYKLVPIDPAQEMIDEGRTARTHPMERYKAMLAAAPTVEPVGFCEDTVLSIAERTFNSEVDEHLAEDVIKYARRLHDMYTDPKPTPEVAKLVEALEQVIKAAPSSGPLWYGSEQIVEARAALSAHRNQGGDL